MEIQFDLNNYRQFIINFRNALRVGANRDHIQSESVDVICGSGRGFRYNVKDLYLTHIKMISGSEWQKINNVENYSQMGVYRTETPITGQSIRNAFLFNTSLTARALVILATSEAARSNVVYQVIQQLLRGRFTTWQVLLPLLRNWGNYTSDFHKRRPISYGPLGLRDYLIIGCSAINIEEKATLEIKNTLEILSKNGFYIDP